MNLLKKIKIEQTFAEAIHKQFMVERYGISSCCYVNFDESILKKYICDWQDIRGTDLCTTCSPAYLNPDDLHNVNCLT